MLHPTVIVDPNLNPLFGKKRIVYNLKNILIEYSSQENIYDQIKFDSENILNYQSYTIDDRKFIHLRFKNLTQILNKDYHDIRLYTIRNFVSCQNRYSKTSEKFDFNKKTDDTQNN
jgi:hypothetical protein